MRPARFWLILAAAPCLIFAAPAQAQDVKDESVVALVQKVAPARANQVALQQTQPVFDSAITPTAAAPVGQLNGVTLLSAQENGNAELKLGRAWNAVRTGPEGRSYGRFDLLSVVLSTPVSKGGDQTNFATLDGLAKSTYVSLQLSRLYVPGVDGEVATKGICDRLALEHPGTPCGTDTVFKFLGEAEAISYNKARAAADAGRDASIQFGVIGKFGHEDYTYYAPVTLAKADLNRNPWQLGGYIARIGSRGNSTLMGEYLHEDSYKENTSVTACLAGAGPVLKCVTGAIGPATRMTKDLLSVEYRWSMSEKADKGSDSDASPRFAVAPKITFDAHSGAYGGSLPVYLVGDGKNLTAGVRADWTSDKHHTVVGIFLTKAFSAAPGV